MITNYTPYSTAVPFLGTLPQWMRSEDAERVQAYSLYEQMYWNVPDVYSVQARDASNESPIYIPSARIIVEACNRFLGKDFDFVVDPASDRGGPQDKAALALVLGSLFIREGVRAKFNSQKRYGLIRGDAVYHFVADPAKPQGKRISIYEVDPASYFPIYDPDNPDKLTGVHLVDQHIDENTENTVIIRRQTYRKDPETGQITTELTYWENGSYETWDDRVWGGNKDPQKSLKLVRTVVPVTPLDPRITAIPVYLVRNVRNPADPFGSSELRGLETLANGINNTISDEDLALALNGLGVYATDAPAPKDSNGNETDWILGPGVVVTIADGKKFTRVSGVTDIAPFQEHLKYLEDRMRSPLGVGDIASGKVDVAIAQSGIALRLQLQPILSGNSEKEDELSLTWDHMLYDLTTMWYPVYEQTDFNGALAGSVFGDPVPVDKDKVLEDVLKMIDAGLMDAETARAKLAEIGWVFPTDSAERIIAEQTALAEARMSDPFMERIRREAAGAEGSADGGATA